MGEALFEGLGGALRGLERGLLLKRQLKEDALDRAIQAEDRALMQQDRAMQQREFELRMKQAGLALESAEFEHERALAFGTPKEQADRELSERQQRIQMDLEEHAARLANIRAETAASEASAEATRALAAQRTSGGGRGGESELSKDFEDALGQVDDQIKFYQDVVESPDSSDEQRQYAQQQLVALSGQRENLFNSWMNEKGFPSDFRVGGTEAAGAGEQAPAAAGNTGGGGLLGLVGKTLGAHPGPTINDILFGVNPETQGLLESANDLREFSENPSKGFSGRLHEKFRTYAMMRIPASKMADMASTESDSERNRILAEYLVGDENIGPLIKEANLGPEVWQMALAGAPFVGKVPILGKMIAGAGGKAVSGGEKLLKSLGLIGRSRAASGATKAASAADEILALPSPQMMRAHSGVIKSGPAINLGVDFSQGAIPKAAQVADDIAAAIPRGIPGGGGPMISGPVINPYAAMAGAARNTAAVGRGLAPVTDEAAEVLLRGLSGATSVGANAPAAAGPMIAPAVQGAGYFGPSMMQRTVDLRALVEMMRQMGSGGL